MCPGLAVAWCEWGACLGEGQGKRVSLIWAHWEMWLGMSFLSPLCAPRKHGWTRGALFSPTFLVPRYRPKLSSQTEGRSGVVGETQITGLISSFIFLSDISFQPQITLHAPFAYDHYFLDAMFSVLLDSFCFSMVCSQWILFYERYLDRKQTLQPFFACLKVSI